ncbi:tyrosine-protein phosphatase pmp1 [Colletotrichum spaethianum]|uniref:diphosphoinositol-polyphosphate diphosphatase n=1 Tax=Colletotrichum spaethianum TaxID=700344 RepID=A0AA37LA22_9PEZI|nr:tyrosine-protein phosphatase pmp1 [Colletotrichum spaethianum]GKT44593.1 tyrosine-protein phosphatase pmp1 [Colletotrichum spaethianum]
MAVAMVSKRSTRLFLEDEGGHPEEDPTYRPTRRNSKQEDPAPLELADKYQAKGPSRQGSRESVAAPDAAVDVHVQKQVAMVVEDVKAAVLGEKVPARREDSLEVFDDRLKPPMASPISSVIERVLPIDGRPINFGVVVPGVYRSSYPKPEDFGFIRNLGLKSIVTLVQKDDVDEPYTAFMSGNGIRHHVFNMKGTKKEAIPIRTMKAILRLVLNREHHPLLIHCNHGKHRTGCVVGVVRKVTGWELNTIVDEYRTYAEPKVRDCDIKYLTDFDLSDLSNLFVHDANMRFRIRHFVRVTLFSVFVIFVWLLSGHRMQTTARRVKDVR